MYQKTEAKPGQFKELGIFFIFQAEHKGTNIPSTLFMVSTNSPDQTMSFSGRTLFVSSHMSKTNIVGLHRPLL